MSEKISFNKDLFQKILSGTPLIQVISYENERFEGILQLFLKEQEYKYRLFRWSMPRRLEKYNSTDRVFESMNDREELVSAIDNYRGTDQDTIDKFEHSILFVKDLHFYLDPNSAVRPQLIAHLREFAENNHSTRTIIFIQPITDLPVELSKSTIIMDLPLPPLKLLRSTLSNVISSLNVPDANVDETSIDELAGAALGLTYQEARQTFKELIQRYGKIDHEGIPFVISRKEQIIKQNGILEYFHPKEGFGDVGGLTQLKEWLRHRRMGFTKEAIDFGLEPPKGVLLLGIPGGGKSLIAKSIASDWKLPLLKFDIGRVFAGIVGESEANVRKAIQVANTIAPAILWIDEIEKGLSGVGSSDQTDGGTTSRIFGTILTWMQEKEEPVFVVATANDVSKLPPELLRKGRFDEIFFVDLPGEKSRKDIWMIHLNKRIKESEIIQNLNLKQLIEASIGYTGAEIEGAINEGLYIAFGRGSEINTDVFLEAISKIYPLSKVRFENLNKLRIWAKHRARLASDEDGSFEMRKNEEKVPILKNELDLDMFGDD
ncbi:MAG: AAA family ATPase [Candidatus Heimdallarchaeota archaeon]|nr:AAA family ATPase [Candidatus Heimdallarchaeota archaeon]